jgi:hypothetical protein
VTTTIDTHHPLLNTNAERMRIQAMLRHLGSGADLRDLPASASEKLALVKTANQRGLIAWHKNRNRYELTAAGWCELAPTRRFGVGSIMVGTTLGATLGAAALAVFWFTAGAAHISAPAPRSATASHPAQVAKLSASAVDRTASVPAPVASTPAPAEPTAASPAPAEPTASAAPSGTPAPSASLPAREVAPAAPATAPVEAEPARVAAEPTPEQVAEAAKAKQAAAKKARQRAAAARRRREETARAWAASEPSRTREAEYVGHGVYGGYGYGGYGGYGGRNAWFAYR